MNIRSRIVNVVGKNISFIIKTCGISLSADDIQLRHYKISLEKIMLFPSKYKAFLFSILLTSLTYYIEFRIVQTF